MRLPCERYLRVCILRSHTTEHLHRALLLMGYPKAEHVSELNSVILQLQRECAAAENTAAGPSPDVLVRWGLTGALHNDKHLREVEYMLRYPELCKFIDMAFISGAVAEEVSGMLRRYREMGIAKEALVLYQHLILDIASLSPYELELFFEVHARGDVYRSCHIIGEEGAAFYAGEEVVFDAEKAFEFVCQGAYLKIRELLLGGDPITAAAPVKNYAAVMETSRKMMGPGLSSKRLRDRVGVISIAVAELQAERVRAGLQVTGRVGARVELAEIQDVLKQVNQCFSEEMQLLPAPGGENVD